MISYGLAVFICVISFFLWWALIGFSYNVKNNRQESRREWMLNLFSAAGNQNNNNVIYQFWQQSNHPVLLDALGSE